MTTVKLTYREAVRAALSHALATDERVFLMGEDLGGYGGAFAVSLGLLDEYGPERVRNTPLSESGFVGAGIGAALGGMRPIVEVMTINFSLLALDQVVNNAATLHYMSGGQMSVPLVVRMATGGGRQLAAQHAHSLEAWYAHIPGIRALAPATVDDARGMLLAAVEDPDPVFIFEHATLYPLEDEVEEEPRPVDIAHAIVRREGMDVTLVTYGGSLGKCLDAAEQLQQDGIEAEVIDLRTLRPLDMSTVLASLAKTHRIVIVDEGWRTGSLAGEISAQIMESGFDLLDWPVQRLCSAEVPIPYAKHLEDAALPSAGRVAALVREMAI
ncbi:MAG: alpha-ketoacid dehydrogenase subunit beta [Thermoleophilia bacterium]|nr:alpha-ketoacid dehydrogenase subunit beta [Thermoleophilia bacterium]MDH4339019.1 alpha-ketoacid dehydrogenase subunit beta [Thermoleophilia bacterium]MDH5281219.1 alpha-ketoacid dehydrogenase subunit beta [Thermoleophilia bacterium]